MLRCELLLRLGRIRNRRQRLLSAILGRPKVLLLHLDLHVHLRAGLSSQAGLRRLSVFCPFGKRSPLRCFRSGTGKNNGKIWWISIDVFQLLGVVFAHMLAKAVRRIKTEIEMENQANRQRFYAELVAEKENKDKLSSTLYTASDA